MKNVSLILSAGETLGIAGVDGSGQLELFHAVLGLRRPAAGSILLNGKDVTSASTEHRLRAGLAYCPEDRQRDGLILPFSIAENLLLGRHRRREYGGGLVLSRSRVRAEAVIAMSVYQIQAPSPEVPASVLSGGNQQKLVIARALASKPALLVAMNLTRGLDLHATRRVYEMVAAAKATGLAVLLVSLDLDELTQASDRIAVLYAGTLAGVVERGAFDRDVLGRLMTTGSHQ